MVQMRISFRSVGVVNVHRRHGLCGPASPARAGLSTQPAVEALSDELCCEDTQISWVSSANLYLRWAARRYADAGEYVIETQNRSKA